MNPPKKIKSRRTTESEESTFTLNYFESWSATFLVNIPKAAPACMDSLEHFGDPITRSNDSDEEKVVAFLKLWGPYIIAASRGMAADKIITELAGGDGAIPLDGSRGIKLVACDFWNFDEEDFSVEITGPNPAHSTPIPDPAFAL